MNRAALYIRVSTLEQAQEGYSVGEQKERLIAYCKAKDWIIADIYVDGGYTGSNLNRPGIQKLISETDKFDLVLVYKLDRLSRSQRDTLYLIEEVFRPKGVDFISMQESFDTSTPFGKAMIGLLAVFAQLEREQIKERTWMGRVARAKTGLHHGGGHIPIGYEYEDGHLVINPYEAEQVRKIYEWYLAGDSLKTITDKLQEVGYTNKYSSYSSWTSVRNILGNETYTGRLHFGDVIVDNAHEPIISKEQFDAAQVLRGKRQEQYGGQAFQSKHLLARPHLLRPLRRQILPTEHRQVFLLRLLLPHQADEKHGEGPELHEQDMERRGAGSHCGRPDSGASQLTGDGRRDRYQPLQARPSQQERGHRKEAPGNRQANRQAHGAVPARRYTARASGRAYQQTLQRAHRVGIHPCPGGRG